MNPLPGVIPITDLRQDAAAVLRQVRSSKAPLIVTQRGRAAAIMMSVEAYEQAEYERGMLRLLARGEREIVAGKGFGLKQVLTEADALLAQGEE